MCNAIIRAFLSVFLLAVVVPYAWSQEFYKDKTVRIIVGVSPGAQHDIYARVMARFMPKYIPGNPTIIVENMPGAGGLVAANHIYHRVKPDGLTIGAYSGHMIVRHVLGHKGVTIDGRELGWLGAFVPASQVCTLTKAAGIKTAADWLAAKRPVVLGGLSPGSDTVDLPKIMAATTTLPSRVVEGFKGVADAIQAAHGGEIDGICFAWYGMRATWGQALESGEVRVILQNVLEPVPELPHAPLVTNYAKDNAARELLQAALKVYSTPVFVHSVAPGTPQDRLQILQTAFAQALKDLELLKTTEQMKLEIKPMDGPSLTRAFRELYKVAPGLIAKIREITLPTK